MIPVFRQPAGAYSVEGPNFVVFVEVDGAGLISTAAPLVRRFVGQPFENLTRWIRGRGFESMVHDIRRGNVY